MLIFTIKKILGVELRGPRAIPPLATQPQIITNHISNCKQQQIMYK